MLIVIASYKIRHSNRERFSLRIFSYLASDNHRDNRFSMNWSTCQTYSFATITFAQWKVNAMGISFFVLNNETRLRFYFELLCVLKVFYCHSRNFKQFWFVSTAANQSHGHCCRRQHRHHHRYPLDMFLSSEHCNMYRCMSLAHAQ